MPEICAGSDLKTVLNNSLNLIDVGIEGPPLSLRS
jgi:hypothetical protein